MKIRSAVLEQKEKIEKLEFKFIQVQNILANNSKYESKKSEYFSYYIDA